MPSLTKLQSVLIVAGGFVCYFLADGYTYSIGILYSHLLSTFHTSSSSAAALPGLLYSVPQFTAIFLCPLLETYGYSSGAAWGAILLCTSCLASAFAPNFYVLYFTLGAVASVGLQLTYSSAIMAVTDAFKNEKLFGLAVGLTMCGSGVGSFSANPFIAWMLESWNWRELMLIESAILLHSMVSASCFHHLDAINFRFNAETLLGTKNEAVEAHAEADEGLALTEINHYALDDDTEGKVHRQSCSMSCCVESVWSFLRYILCLPSRYRFKRDSFRRKSQQTSVYESEEMFHDGSCVEFWHALTVSLKQLVSAGLWRNPDFLAYIIANSLTGLGVVIPWTFIYDHSLISLSRDEELDTLNASHVSWLPALIGLGSLSGQIFFGLVTSHFCSCFSKPSSPEPSSELTAHTHNPCFRFIRYVLDRSHCFLLFAGVLSLNGLATLLIALLPFNRLATQISSSASFLQFPIGIIMGTACFLTGISYGGLYVLYPQILMQTVGEQLWPAGLGVFLFSNGAMNLAGTTISGRLFDTTGSYTSAFLLAACVPFIGLGVLITEQILQYRFRKGDRCRSTTPI